MTSTLQRLTDADLDRIFKKFVKPRVHVNCTERHVHGFNCADFDDEQTMVIERLRVEVVMLRSKLRKIEELSK
jgi:hypothetical protein